MTKAKFNNIIIKSIQSSALQYLLGKQGSIGKEVIYSSIKVAEYMMPNYTKFNIEQKETYFKFPP